MANHVAQYPFLRKKGNAEMRFDIHFHLAIIFKWLHINCHTCHL